MKPEFRTDNTEGYDAADLKARNAAWDEITSHGAPTDSDDIWAQSMLQNWAERLLAAYDDGKRGKQLTAWFDGDLLRSDRGQWQRCPPFTPVWTFMAETGILGG